ncbi:MAG: YihY/virulence factor BrkB family protein [Pseudomonadota bacterium]|nr:MAG: YihY/virulence factor BrkB family protein [Pseudomonadota bacterium]
MSMPPRIRYVLDHPLRFTLQVFRGFHASRGFLLASAVAYNTLLSIVPILALSLIALSQFMDRELLLETTGRYLALVAPGQAGILKQQLVTFLDNWKVVGVVGVVMLLFFSSFAFAMLENAMAVIFKHRTENKTRQLWVSVIIPYAYLLVLGAALFVLSAVIAGLAALGDTNAGRGWSLAEHQTTVIYMLGIAGETLLFTSLYVVMPRGRIPLGHAFIGGITAALLWEGMRRVLVWYFASLSIVNVVYGTFATVIIILLSLEAAAVIFLLGAQVIAEYEHIEPPP